MSSFLFDTIINRLPNDWRSKVYLWIWNPDKIPPHIGISNQSDYYSLTYRGIEQLDVPSLLQKANRSKTPFLLIEMSPKSLQTDFNSVFSSYDKAKVNGPTCLTPIKEILCSSSKVNQLADLLVELKKNQQNLQVYGVHLPIGYSQLPEYSVSDIMNRIGELGGE